MDKWTLINVYDSTVGGGDYSQCEYCGHEKIRWVHVMRNNENNELINFGCVCADKVTGTQFNSSIEKFMKLKWIETKKGIRKTYKCFDLLIYFKDGVYKCKIDNEWGKLKYKNIQSAKIGMFRRLRQLMS